MATQTQSTFPMLPRKLSTTKFESRAPAPSAPRDSFERPSIGDDHDVYIGEGLIDSEDADALESYQDDEVPQNPHHHRRRLLDYLAIDVGEKYLDDIYKEDDREDESEDGGFYSDGPRSSFHQSNHRNRHYGRPAAITNPVNVQLGQIAEGQVTRPRAEKEVAWQKVRRFLIEEEEKAVGRKTPHKKGVVKSVDARPEEGVNCYDTIKLLDGLVQSGADSKSSASSGPEVKKHQMENKLAQFLQRGPVPGDLQPTSPYLAKSNNDFVPGSSSARLILLTTLEHVTMACRTTDLSETSIGRITSHLSMIDQIVRDDISWRQKRTGARRLSSTQHTNASSEDEYDTREQTHIVGKVRALVSPAVRNTFKTFVAAQDLCDTLAAFNNLIADCGLSGAKMQEPWHVYYHIRNAVYSKLGFRQKQLFRLLDSRLSMDVYKQRSVSNKRVCIVGAGPVGLRAAVELALLGGHVSVLEKRTKFSRENRLHLWPWVVQDLASLGAKVLFKNFCKSRTYFHVSTRQLQVILLKVALLVGVKVYSTTGFQSIVAPDADGNPFYSIKTEPQIPVAEYTAVLGATGVNNQIAGPAGINRFVFSQKESLGIVCYFPNLETPEEMKVKEFSWTAQLKHHMLHKMREIGIDLENIVYFRGEMHYLVMTPKRQNLLARGVVRHNHPNSKDLVKDSNIKQSVLHAFVKRIVDFTGITRRTDFTRLSLFDFTSLTRAEKAANIMTSHGKKFYVGLIGDSLLEPVWHEGVGTCRGFLSALDGVWMISQIGVKADEQLLADRELAYQVMQRLSGHHRDEMQKNVRKYNVDPRSRYMVDFARVV